MKTLYRDLIDQTFDFPQEGFSLDSSKHLLFNGLDLYSLVKKYGTPLKLNYLPRISEQIQKARDLFAKAMNNHHYKGKYVYCYCTKSSHFRNVIEEILSCGSMLETSSTFDIDLIHKLLDAGKISKQTVIINNGFKTNQYLKKISALINDGFENVIPVLDNLDELAYYEEAVNAPACKVGIRVASEEEPNFQFYTSRLGIRQTEVVPLYLNRIAENPKFELRMLHFFVDTGIKDSIYYWSELKKAIKLYCQLRHLCPTLNALNIGGGMPVRNSLQFEYDFEYMIHEIVGLIKEACTEENIPEPDIYTEFGKYTVGESGALLFSVIGKKQQNDSELWYMVDNSLMTTLPDSWGLNERFILLPINHWDKEYHRVNIGGLSCDNADYYNSEAHINQVFLPKYDKNDEPLYLGFFHTGAYQDSLSGYGGIKHCLLPAPKRVVIRKNEAGEMIDELEMPEQDAESMLRILGY